MRHPTTDDKIVVGRGQRDDHWIYFSVRDSRDHGTIVDFLKRRDGVGLAEVRRELLPWIGGDRQHVQPELYRGRVGVRVVDRDAAAQAFERARPVNNSAYLNARGIKPTTLTADRFAGSFREDRRGNVLFPHRDGAGFAGFESKNHGWTSFSPGGVKALWRSCSLPGDSRLVLVESAIDALSFHQLHQEPRTSYASTAGSMSEHQRSLLRDVLRAMPAGSQVVLAFDRDPAGEKLADEVRALGGAEFSRLRSPIGKDWNDCLQSREREYIQQIGRPASRSRGFER
jgi:hypothetical protein